MARKTELIITCNAQGVQNVMNFLNQRIADIKQRIQELNAAGAASGWTEGMKREVAQLQKEASGIDNVSRRVQNTMVNLQQVIGDLAGSPLRDLKKGLQDGRNALAKMSERDPNREALISDLRKVAREMDIVAGKAMSMREAVNNIRQLGNLSMDRLKQGLEAVNARLTDTGLNSRAVANLQGIQRRYEAEIASREAQSAVSTAPVAGMNAPQLRQQQAALGKAMAGMQGVSGYEQQTARYEARLKEVNAQLQLLAENEKKAGAAARQRAQDAEAIRTFQKVYNNQKVSVEELREAYKTLQQQADRFTGIHPRRAALARQRMQQIKQALDNIGASMEREIRIDRNFLRNATNQQLQDALDRLQRKLQTLNSTQGKAASSIRQQMRAVQGQIEANTGAIQKQSNVFTTAVKNIGAYMGVFAAVNKLKSLIEGVFEANKKLSDSLANIRKVSGLTTQEIDNLYTRISRIDTRNTIDQLNELAYTGAKLGIGQNYGTEGLVGFVKAAEQVQMALGEDMGEQALPALAKMTEVMGLIDLYGVEQSMQKTASAIFQLGATSTATGTNIVEFSKRLYGLANVSNITAQDLLGLGSAADAMGLMPEVASTAFNKLFTSLQRNSKSIEQTLQIPEGTLNSLYTTGRTMDGIVLILERMKETGNMSALGDTFKELGSDGARLINVMATMSDQVDMLKKHLDTSRKSFEKGEAVIYEYLIQNETAAALAERASNLWQKAFVNTEGVDMVTELTRQWYEMSRAMTQSEGQMASLRSTLQFLVGSFEVIIRLMPQLIRTAMIYVGIMAARGIYDGIRSGVLAVQRMIVALRTASGAARAFNIALNSNAIMLGLSLVISGVMELWTRLNAADEAAERMRKRQEELRLAFEQSQKTVGKAASQLDNYKKAVDTSNFSLEERNRLLKENLTAEYQDYLDYLGLETDSLTDLAEAYNMVADAMRKRKAWEERERYRDEVNGENKRERMRKSITFDETMRRYGSDYNREWLTEQVRNGRTRPEIQGDILQNAFPEVVTRVNGKTRINSGADNYGEYLQATKDVRTAVEDFMNAWTAETSADEEIDKMYADMVGDYDPEKWAQNIQQARIRRRGKLQQQEDEKELKKADREHRSQLKTELKQAQDDAKGVIAKIEEWYRIQEAAINEARADSQITEDEARQMVTALNISKNDALATARRAVTEGGSEAWDNMKRTLMPLVQADAGDLSSRLLGEIQEVSIESLHRLLSRFNGGMAVYGLDSGAFFDQMRAKAAGNQRESARLRRQITNQVEKFLSRYQFIDEANKRMRGDLQQMGFVTETYEQWAQRMREGDTSAHVTTLADGSVMTDEEAYTGMGNKFIRQGEINFRYNMENEEEALLWVENFATDAEGRMEKWAQAFPQIIEWLNLVKTREKDGTLGEAELQAMRDALPQIRSLYDGLLVHADRVNEAVKKAFDYEKKQQDMRFTVKGYREEESREDKSLETSGQMKSAGVGQTLSEQLGLDKIADDPEVMRIQNRIYWRNQELLEARSRLEQQQLLDQQELAQMQQKGAAEEEIEARRLEQKQANAGLEELIRDRQTALFDETNNLTVKVAQEMKKRVDSIRDFVKPVTDFTQSAGRKIGDMVFNMESESATWNELWKNMALAVGQSVIEMGAQYLQNLIIQKSINAASEQEAISDATVKTTAGIAAGSAKTIGELGWWGIPLIGVISALLMGLLQSALSSRQNTSSTAAPKTKLASGMLTYDKGNVRQYMGQDGRVYRATEEPAPADGLVTRPIATTVQGQPALVAERGPEIVIGRETTRAIMMNEPQLIDYLANYETQRTRVMSGYRAFDAGTLTPGGSTTDTDGSEAAAMRQTLGDLNRALSLLQQRLDAGIGAYVNMFGQDGLYESHQRADKFMRRYNRR